MKKIFIILLILAASAANAQNYTYNRVFYDGLVLKMKGTVSLTDTTFSAMSSGGFGTTHYQNTTNDNRKHKR